MTLERAIVIATKAHVGQSDRYGQPYIFHPFRVMMKMHSDDERIVAVLHDVLEKSDLYHGYKFYLLIIILCI